MAQVAVSHSRSTAVIERTTSASSIRMRARPTKFPGDPTTDVASFVAATGAWFESGGTQRATPRAAGRVDQYPRVLPSPPRRHGLREERLSGTQATRVRWSLDTCLSTDRLRRVDEVRMLPLAELLALHDAHRPEARSSDAWAMGTSSISARCFAGFAAPHASSARRTRRRTSHYAALRFASLDSILRSGRIPTATT